MKASCRSLYREGYVSAETDGNDGQRYRASLAVYKLNFLSGGGPVNQRRKESF